MASDRTIASRRYGISDHLFQENDPIKTTEIQTYTMAANADSVVILRNHMDWDNWMREIRMKAMAHNVWQYIDPESEKPPRLAPPREPDFEAILSSNSDESTRKIRYEIAAGKWNREEKVYQAKKAGISSLITVISQSLAIEHRYLLDEVDMIADEDGIQIDPRSILLKLQDKLKPRKWESDLKVWNDWQSLQRGWNRKISLDDWLNQWAVIYRQARKLELYDFPEERVFSDFLITIKPIDPQFPSQIDTERRLGHKESFESVVNRFREMRRRESEHPAHRQQIEAYPSFRGQDQGITSGASKGAAPATRDRKP